LEKASRKQLDFPEVKRMRRMPEDKIQKWLDSPDREKQ
jgi:hypothetical protein